MLHLVTNRFSDKNEIKQNTAALMDFVNINTAWLIDLLYNWIENTEYSEKVLVTIYPQVVAFCIFTGF